MISSPPILPGLYVVTNPIGWFPPGEWSKPFLVIQDIGKHDKFKSMRYCDVLLDEEFIQGALIDTTEIRRIV